MLSPGVVGRRGNFKREVKMMEYKLKFKNGKWIWIISYKNQIEANSMPQKYSNKFSAKRGLERFIGRVYDDVTEYGAIELVRGG